MSTFVSPDVIRAAFSGAMSQMYRQEVPLYGDLIDIVAAANSAALAADPAMASALGAGGELGRLGAERHGAIRVGTAEELSGLRRIFAVMGMHPVGYYDLSVAGVPVHSTAFRPTESDSLRRNPFRVFTSLLRLDLIENVALRERAAEILKARHIFTRRAIELVVKFEEEGGLSQDDADMFVAEILETFRWHHDALVDAPTYQRLNAVHRLVADIVSFRGPHINHLTPRTLDIDAAQRTMQERGIDAKAVIEGPPRRVVPVLLRQTSFKALEERIQFLGEGVKEGSHTARFGEIEQRGVALTRAGRALYDHCLSEARGSQGSQGEDYETRLRKAFADFPDTLVDLRDRELAYFHYEVTPDGRAAAQAGLPAGTQMADWIDAGWVRADPITYEDFLPVSAAGIFQSNLGGAEQAAYQARSSQESFEAALGMPVLDPFVLYERAEERSRSAVVAVLSPLCQTGAA